MSFWLFNPNIIPVSQAAEKEANQAQFQRGKTEEWRRPKGGDRTTLKKSNKSKHIAEKRKADPDDDFEASGWEALFLCVCLNVDQLTCVILVLVVTLVNQCQIYVKDQVNLEFSMKVCRRGALKALVNNKTVKARNSD